jgi:hypothetical protein
MNNKDMDKDFDLVLDTKMDMDMDMDTDLNIVKNLFECYSKGYRPPQWIISKFSEVLTFYKSTELYYDSDLTKERALELYTKREPVNIAMSRYYNRGSLMK